jgi:hypothetical protein
LELVRPFWHSALEAVTWLVLYDGSEAVAWLSLGLYDAQRLSLGWDNGSVAWLVVYDGLEAVAWPFTTAQRSLLLGLSWSMRGSISAVDARIDALAPWLLEALVLVVVVVVDARIDALALLVDSQ